MPSGPTDLSVCTSKTQRSSVSCVCCPVTTTTSFCTDPAASHSARARQGASGAKEANLCGRGVGEGAGGPRRGNGGGRRTGKLRKHVLEVGVERVVRRDKHGQAVLVHAAEGLWWVDATLVKDRVDAVTCGETGAAASFRQRAKAGHGPSARVPRWRGRRTEELSDNLHASFQCDVALCGDFRHGSRNCAVRGPER